jgi:HEPN domain-containing protein
MPHDPQGTADARAWFKKAETDLRAADVAMRATPPLLAHAAFNAQQAAEKALKGILTWHDIPFRKTHNLVELGEAVGALERAWRLSSDARRF